MEELKKVFSQSPRVDNLNAAVTDQKERFSEAAEHPSKPQPPRSNPLVNRTCLRQAGYQQR